MPDFNFRTDWKAAKTAAAQVNGGRAIDIDKRIPGFDLGPRLDAWEKAAEAFDQAKNTDRAAAALADFRGADRAAAQALGAYTMWLTHSEVALRSFSVQARADLNDALTVITGAMYFERKRLSPDGPVPWKPDPPVDPPAGSHPLHDPALDPGHEVSHDPPLEPDHGRPHDPPHDPPHEGGGHGGGHGGRHGGGPAGA